MLKQIVALVILSIAISLTMPYTQQAIQLLLHAHNWISQILTDVFAGGQTGKLIKNLIALLSIPMLLGLLFTICYWIVRRHWFPYFMETVWIIWLIQAGALIVIYQSAA
jgi:hypothetical protein